MELVFVILLAGPWLWYDALQAKERALGAGRRACKQLNVQLLDATVALNRIRIGAAGGRGLRFVRDYRFEFSDSGIERRSGYIHMVGWRVTRVQLDLADGLVIL